MTVTLDVPADKYARLAELAQERGVPVEELLGRQIDTLLDRSAAVEQATRYVLAKNAELYRRLAK